MALPLTNLTAHFDASVASPKLWQNYQLNTPYHNTQVAADADPIEVWEDDQSAASLVAIATSGTQKPLWRTTAPLMLLPCADFDGVNDSMYLADDPGTTNTSLGTLFGAGAKTLLMAIYIEGATLNSGNVWENHSFISDALQLFGLHMRNNAGQIILQAYNYDLSIDVVEKNVSVSTSYVVMVRHDGTNLYISLDGGAESSVASGNTDNTGGALVIGANTLNARIGEFATYNAALTGTPQTDALAHFTGRWISGGGGGGGVFSRIVGDRFALAGAGGLVT